MREDHVQQLVDPQSGGALRIAHVRTSRGASIVDGELRDDVSGRTYPIVAGIPRFVPSESYAANFGFQWNRHARTQHDAQSGLGISGRRFREATRWPADLHGWRVLEAGCGSGRFTRHALDAGAFVVSFDISSAVDALAAQLGDVDRLLLIQADARALPLRPRSFDGVYCFGVLQHTPRPRETFLALSRMVAPGGRIATDIYAKTLGRYWLNTKYWVRPITRRIAPRVLYGFTSRYVERMWPLARALRRVPRIGQTLAWRMLIADYSREFPQAPDEQLKEWAVLDTFDMLSPAFDRPATAGTYRAWHREAGLTDIEVARGHNGFEGRGRIPASSPAAPASGG